MKILERIILSLSGGVIEFSWLYAWAAFVGVSVGGRGFPLIDAVLIFVVSAAVMKVVAGRGLRVITLGTLEAIGIFLTVTLTLYGTQAVSGPFLDFRWVQEFFSEGRSAMDWLGVVVVILSACAFWFSGTLFAVRPPTHERLCSRFDLGVAAFFCLILIRFALSVKGQAPAAHLTTIVPVGVFFCFGLVGVGITRTGGTASSRSIKGRRMYGIIMAFTLTVFGSVAALILFFGRPLAAVAGTGYGLVRAAASSVGAVFIRFLKFLYLPRQVKIRQEPSGAGGHAPDWSSGVGGSDWAAIVGKILAWLFGSFLGLVVLFAVAAAVIYTIRWLLSRTAKSSRSERSSFPAFIVKISAFARWIVRKVRILLRGRNSARDHFAALMAWSRLSGVRRGKSETPSEFSGRLARIFPTVGNDIEHISEAFNREYYGEIGLTGDEIDGVRRSFTRLKSPGLWSARLRTLLSGTVSPLP